MNEPIVCPACVGVGEYSHHEGFGVCRPVTCRCCEGKKFVDAKHAYDFIHLLMMEAEDEKCDRETADRKLTTEQKVTEQLHRDLCDAKILVEHYRAKAGCTDTTLVDQYRSKAGGP